ncbi:hypothetical protein I4U23_023817 [Adineta vaga]|nr:hypothetical protein I4U23_023817 [Adineta vaga]
MAGTCIIIMLLYLLIISNTFSYSVENRVSSILDNRRISSQRILNNSSRNFDECNPLHITRDLQCSFIPKDYQYYELFEAICKQHRLCYACGTVHGISKRKCNSLSRVYTYEQCTKNPLIESDCLRKRVFALISFQEDIYRLSEFSSECYDHCIISYLFSNPNIK